MAYLFVIGTGRCGSTLMNEVLAGHRDVGFISAADERLRALGLKGRWNSSAYRLSLALRDRGGAMLAPAWLAERAKPSEAWLMLDEQVSAAMSMPFRDLTAADASPWLTQRLRDFFESRMQAQGKRVFLHKFTGWPRVGLVDAAIPEARFLHVVRDGRAVANSWLQMRWWAGYRGPSDWTFGPLPEAYEREWTESGRSFAVLAGIQWKILLDAFDEALSTIPEQRRLEVRYEDFIASPRESMARILDLAGLPWDAEFERRFSRYEFRAGRSNAYRSELSPRDVELLDRSLAEHLAGRGYPAGG